MSDNGLSETTIDEPGGVHLGQHVVTGDDIIVDPFSRPDNCTSLVLGDPDSGKFAGAARLLTRVAQHDETVVLLVDPLKELAGLNAKLDGESIVIGDETGINPLELRKTPPRICEEMAAFDPYREKVDQVIDFFDAYFGLVGQPLSATHRGVFGYAIDEAYERQGITDDPTTHDRPSPTVRTVGDVLADLAHNPQLPIYTETAITDAKRREWQACAAELVEAIEPLQSEGRFGYLGSETDLNLVESGVSYLNLGKTVTLPEAGMLMKQLIGTGYQQAKQTDERVLITITGAQYLLRDAGSVHWLEQVTQYGQHHDLWSQFITHSTEEFLTSAAAGPITENCSLKVIHRHKQLTNAQTEALRLSTAESTFIRNCGSGTTDSEPLQALLILSGAGKVPIQFAPTGAQSTTNSTDEREEN